MDSELKMLDVKYTEFTSKAEWLYTCILLRSQISFKDDEVIIDHNRLEIIIEFIEKIIMRNSKTVPIALSVTYDLLKILTKIKDPNCDKEALLVLIRSVNLISDIEQSTKGKSISQMLETINLKEYNIISEIRHSATHKILPSFHLTQKGIQIFLKDILEMYWEKQFVEFKSSFHLIVDKLYKYSKKIYEESEGRYLDISPEIEKIWIQTRRDSVKKNQIKPNQIKTNLIEFRLSLNKKIDEISKLNDKQEQIQAIFDMQISKKKLSRGLLISEIFKRYLFKLTNLDYRREYIKSGQFKKELDVLDAVIKYNDDEIFTKFIFLKYKVQRIFYLQELDPAFQDILSLLEKKIPIALKKWNIDKKSKIKAVIEKYKDDIQNISTENNPRRKLSLDSLVEEIKFNRVEENMILENQPRKKFRKVEDWKPQFYGTQLASQFF